MWQLMLLLDKQFRAPNLNNQDSVKLEPDCFWNWWILRITWFFLSMFFPPLFTDAFRGIFKYKPNDKEYALPMIHVYGFSKARDPEFDFHEVCCIKSFEELYLFFTFDKLYAGLGVCKPGFLFSFFFNSWFFSTFPEHCKCSG